MIIAGDIGGTKTNLGLYSRERGARNPLREAMFVSGDYESLDAIVSDFLNDEVLTVEHAVFGIAGPVVGSEVNITNLPWTVSKEGISEKLRVKRIHLINDLEAIAHSIPHLTGEDLHTLNSGQRDDRGTMAVVAPGTGLGEAFLVHDNDGYRAHASEGGHVDFAPTDAVEIKLLQYLRQRYGHVSYERVCSGRGIPDIYAFLRDSRHGEEPEWLAEELAAVSDVAPVIIANALHGEKSCPLCAATLDIFLSVLGAKAGNLALTVMATGGVYIGGGIAPRIIPALQRPSFSQAFTSKGRLSGLMEGIPLHVITNPKAALIGAARYGLERETQ